MSKLMQQISVMRRSGKDLVAFQTWIPLTKGLKVGSIITFKDLEHDWTVTHIYDTQIEMEEVTSNRGWDNNNYDKHDSSSMKDRVKK
jgi:hypothetical protein